MQLHSYIAGGISCNDRQLQSVYFWFRVPVKSSGSAADCRRAVNRLQQYIIIIIHTDTAVNTPSNEVDYLLCIPYAVGSCAGTPPYLSHWCHTLFFTFKFEPSSQHRNLSDPYYTHSSTAAVAATAAVLL